MFIIYSMKIDERDIETIKNLIHELDESVKLHKNYGPFLAGIYDTNYNLISKAYNTVIKDNCSIHHAEINAITKAQKSLHTYNLSPYNLGIYITSEPCMMCLGAIMWSGIKRIYFSVSSEKVEEITGFNEGLKQNWIVKFKKMGFEIHPYILSKDGEKPLIRYTETGGIIYKPE